MAVLYVTEFADGTIAGLTRGPTTAYPIPAPMTPPVAEQHVGIGALSAQSNAFGNTTKFVMVNTDVACSLAFGLDPTATAAMQRLAANETRFYGVVPGQKLAVIQNP